MSKIHFEQSIMGASVYYDDKLICCVSGLEDAERLQILFSENQKQLDKLKSALAELVEAVQNMDIRKQKEVVCLAEKLLK